MPEPLPQAILARCAALLPQGGHWRLSLAEARFQSKADLVFSGADVKESIALHMAELEGVEAALFIQDIRAINLRLADDALWLNAAYVEEAGEWRGEIPTGEALFALRYVELRARRYIDIPVEVDASPKTRALLAAILLADHSRESRAAVWLAERFLDWHEDVLMKQAAGATMRDEDVKPKKEAIQARGGCAILARAVARLSRTALREWHIEPL